MKQEQKPFEIREANAEIRRLESELKRKSEACIHFAKANQCFMEANMELQQQLDDAPTWGEWVDATEGELSNVSAGVYELEDQAGATEISFMFDGKWQTESCTMSDWTVAKENLRFRRLNYEPQQVKNQGAAKMTNEIPRRNRIDLYTPAEHAIRAAILAVEEMGAHTILTEAVGLLGNAQNKVADFIELEPAREVEKTYWGKTIKELVNDYSDSYEGELARDFLATQAELRELKGKR